MSVGEQTHSVEEVLELLDPINATPVSSGITVMTVDAQQKLLEAAVFTYVGICLVAVDEQYGLFPAGTEYLVIQGGPVARESRNLSHPCRDAFCCLRQSVEEGAANEFLIAIFEEKVCARPDGAARNGAGQQVRRLRRGWMLFWRPV